MNNCSECFDIGSIRGEQKERLHQIQMFNDPEQAEYSLDRENYALQQSLSHTVTIVSPKAIGANAEVHGFRLAGQLSDLGRRPVSELTALLHSEVSEFFEGQREGKGDDEYGGAGEELADIYIRLADTCDEMGIDLATEVLKKHTKNIQRRYLHGKLF